MDKTLLYEEFGQVIVRKLRDENYAYYEYLREFGRSMTLEEFAKAPKKRQLAADLQQLEDERFEFFNGLNPSQLEVLNRLILHLLDGTAFNFLREVEENLDQKTSIGMTINGEKIEHLSSELLSGTLFGEYFLWLEKYSKYGGCQQ